ncbi:geranylgeranylglycerol-phosphate geranylgeranyltransferase [Aquimarina addita]
MTAYLKLIKLDNLLLLVIAQLCIKYGFFDPFPVAITLDSFGITLLIIATLCIGAAGNIIIEIYDKEKFNGSELLNGSISEKSANRWFIILNVIGVLIGFYIANLIEKPEFSALFIISSGLFYLYASYLKELVVIKNFTIAVLISLSLLAVGIFDLLPAITDENRASQQVVFRIITDYTFFASTLILLREIIKDCYTIDTDHNAGLKTIPIILGKERTAKLVSGLTLIPIGMIVYYLYIYLFNNTYAVLYVLILLIAPLLYFMFKSWGAQIQKDFDLLSRTLKVILFLTSMFLLFYQFTILP